MRQVESTVTTRLLIRPGGIGDCITTFPAMEFLRTHYTEVWTNRACIPLLHFADRARCAIARGILLIRFKDKAALQELASEFRRFDQVVTWFGNNIPGVARTLSALHPNICLLDSIPDPYGNVHAVDFHLSQVGAPTGFVTPRVGTYHWKGDGDFIALQPFSSAPYKEWPLDCFVNLETQLAHRYPVRWLVDPDRLPLAIQPKGMIVASTLDEVAEQLTHAKLYIGNDTGISHLAASIGVPSLVLFHTEHPEVWRPRGAGRLVCLEARSKNTPSQVAAVALPLLSG